MEMKSHHGILQFWHFMFDPGYHPRSPKLYINKAINWVVGFIKKGRGLLEKGKSFKGGKYIGIAMHIIQDSFAPCRSPIIYLVQILKLWLKKGINFVF